MLVPIFIVVILGWLSGGRGQGDAIYFRYGQQEVRIGSFLSPSAPGDPVALMKTCALECFAQEPVVAQALIRRIDESVNKTVLELDRMFGLEDAQSSFDQSIAWQTVKHAKDLQPHEEEAWSHLGMVIWTRNYAALNNFAFFLESTGHFEQAKHLFADCYTITNHEGCLLFGLAASPLVLRSEQQAAFIYVHKLAEYYQFFLQRPSRVVPHKDIRRVYDSFREIPVNIHYQGFYPGILMELFSKALVSYFPHLEDAYIPPRAAPRMTSPVQPSPPSPSSKNSPIRVGIVSEYFGNTSPGLCVEDLFVNLPRGFPRIHQVFFHRTQLRTTFASNLAAASHEVFSLAETNVATDLETIRQARLDVLIYIALGTEKQSYFLAHARLAPIQVLVGVGHPLSPGLRSIDYVVLPMDMLLSPAVTREEWVDPMRCAMEAFHCVKNANLPPALAYSSLPDLPSPSSASTWSGQCQLPPACTEPPTSLPYYSEQVVLFESAAHFLKEHRHYPYSTETLEDLARMTGYRAGINPLLCNQLQLRLQSMGLFSLSAEALGCHQVETDIATPKRLTLYHHMHYIKKLHPLLDRFLLRIAEDDPTARILVVEGFYRRILPRMVYTVQHPLEVHRYPRARSWNRTTWETVFVEVPRLPHADYLFLVGLADVMLNAAPYGAGITSSEAWSLCTPVVIWPEASVTIHFALSQVRRLGWQDLFTASSLDDFAQLAMEMARGNMTVLCSRLQGKHQAALREQCLQYAHIKPLLCAAKPKLFGVEVLEAAVWEWRRFLIRIAEAS